MTIDELAQVIDSSEGDSDSQDLQPHQINLDVFDHPQALQEPGQAPHGLGYQDIDWHNVPNLLPDDWMENMIKSESWHIFLQG